MKSVKLVLIGFEAALIIGLALFMWFLQKQGTIEFVEALFAFMLAMAAIVIQKEQQEISWKEDED